MNNRSKSKKTSAPLLGGASTKPRSKFNVRGDRGSFRVQASIPLSALVTAAGGGGSAAASYLTNPGYFPSYIKNIAQSYQLFRIARMTYEYVPVVGATTNGALRIAFLDNPETIYGLASGAYTATDISNLVFSSTTSKATSVWNGTTFNVPAGRMNRRKWYSIDSTNVSSPEQCDRALPFIAVVTFEGALSTTIGYLMCHFTFELRDLAAATSTPLFNVVADDEEPFLGAGGLWWKRVPCGLVQVDPPNTLSC